MRSKKPKVTKLPKGPKTAKAPAHKVTQSMSREHPSAAGGRPHKVKSTTTREHPVEPMGLGTLRGLRRGRRPRPLI